MADKEPAKAEAARGKPAPDEKPEDAVTVHCMACGHEWETSGDLNAEKVADRPYCPKCHKRKVVSKDHFERMQVDAVKDKRQVQASEAYGDTEAQARELEKILADYGVAEAKAIQVLLNWRRIPHYHDKQQFFLMMTQGLKVEPAQAMYVTEAFFTQIGGGGTPAPFFPLAPQGPGASQFGPYPSPYGPPYGAPGAAPVPMTREDVDRMVSERVAKEREADRVKALEERNRAQEERIRKLEAGEGVAKPGAAPGSGKVRVIKQPIIDPETRQPLTDARTGAVLYTYVEEPIEQETSEERLVRLLQEKGLIGQRTEPEAPRWATEMTAAVKALKPIEPVRPSAEMETKLDKARQDKEDAEKAARTDREKLQRDLDAARAETATEKQARALNERLDPIQRQLEAARRETEELRSRPPGTDPHLARMQGEQGLLKTGSEIAMSTVDKTMTLIATSPVGQAMAATQRMEVYMKAVQFAQQNKLDPTEAARMILAGPLAVAPTPAERRDLTEKMKAAAEGKGAGA